MHINFHSACIKPETTAREFREELLRHGSVSIPSTLSPLLEYPDDEILMPHLAELGYQTSKKDGIDQFWVAGSLITPIELSIGLDT